MIYISNQTVDKDHVVGATLEMYKIERVADNNQEVIWIELGENSIYAEKKALYRLIGPQHIEGFMGEYPVTAPQDLVGKTVYSYELDPDPNVPPRNKRSPQVIALEPRVR